MQYNKLLKITIPAIFFIAILGQLQKSFTYASGPPAGHTDAPGESNCASCHSSTVNSNSSTIKLKTQQSTSNFEYLPDSTYTVTVDFSPFSGSKYGFQTTALVNSNNTMAGTFTITNNSQTQKTNTFIGSGNRDYVMHTNAGTSVKTWSFQWKAPSKNVGDIKFYVAANGANGNSNTSGDVIYTNNFTFAPSPKLPVATMTASTTSVCAGDSVSFTGSGTNSTLSYKWTFVNGTPATSTAQNPKVKYNISGNFPARLIVSNAYGESIEVSTTISVKAMPSDVVLVAGAKEFCEGDSVKLTASSGVKFDWNTGQKTQSIYVRKSGDYFVNVTNASNCQVVSKTITIKVFEQPTVNLARIYGADSICVGDSLVFEAFPEGKEYAFFNGGTILQQGTSKTLTLRNLAPGKYNITVMSGDSNGCVSPLSAPVTATVVEKLTAPVLSCGTSTTNSISINWNTIAGAVNYQVSEDTGKTWQSTNNTFYDVENLDADKNVLLQVRAVDNTVCKSSPVSAITCKSLPCSQLTYNFSADTVICEGSTANISFQNMSSPTYYLRVDGGAPTKITEFNLLPTVDTSVSISLYDSSKPNCEAITHNINITVDKMPALSVITDKPAYCKGESVKLIGTGEYSKYSFYKNNVWVVDASNPEHTFTDLINGDTLQITGSTINNCVRQSEQIRVKIEDRTNPGFTYSTDKLNATFTDTTRNVSTRLWKFTENNTSTDSTATFEFPESGEYTVWLFTLNGIGCIDSVAKTLNVTNVGIKENAILQVSAIYPNPFENNINVILYSRKSSKVNFVVSDLNGRDLLISSVQSQTGKNDLRIPASDLPAGIYVIRIQSENQVIVKKIIKVQER